MDDMTINVTRTVDRREVLHEVTGGDRTFWLRDPKGVRKPELHTAQAVELILWLTRVDEGDWRVNGATIRAEDGRDVYHRPRATTLWPIWAPSWLGMFAYSTEKRANGALIA